ncbi:MAG: HDOD domain-containing protein [Ignavibacteriales bacterium]|nr:MAG: HDOD domain-containing protein [Ignavibacteriales bacterium]
MMTMISTQQQRKSKTELVLTNIYNLPPIPKIITEVLKLIENEKTSTSELSKVISKDQGLVTKILTIANSPLYGLQRKVTTIDFAVMILGFSELRSIVSVLSMIESFRNKTDKYLDQKEFWIHSFLTGTATKRIAEDLGFSNSGEAFIVGFLHEMGVSVMHRYLHSNFMTICDLVNTKGYTYPEAEMEVLGMNHQQIGNFLMERWNFPSTLSQAVLNHHTPTENSSNVILPSLIHLADLMTKTLRVGNFKWDDHLVMDVDAIKALGFHFEDDVEKFIARYNELFTNQLEAIRHIS